MNDQKTPPWVVWWVLWAAMQAGVFVFYYVLGGSVGPAGAQAADSPLWRAACVPFGVSVVIRWLLLPRVRSAAAALPLFVVGVGLAEACCFLGLFIFPQHKQDLFLVSVLGIAQFVPVFARRYCNQDQANRKD